MSVLKFADESACLRSSPPICPTTCPLSHNASYPTGNVCSQCAVFERASSCPIIYPLVTYRLLSTDACMCHDAQCARESDVQFCARPQQLYGEYACGRYSQREQARVVHACSERFKTATRMREGVTVKALSPPPSPFTWIPPPLSGRVTVGRSGAAHSKYAAAGAAALDTVDTRPQPTVAAAAVAGSASGTGVCDGGGGGGSRSSSSGGDGGRGPLLGSPSRGHAPPPPPLGLPPGPVCAVAAEAVAAWWWG